METVIKDLWELLQDLRPEMLRCLQQQGWSLRRIASAVGISHIHVSRLIDESNSNPEILLVQAAAEGRITHKHLALLMNCSQSKARKFILQASDSTTNPRSTTKNNKKSKRGRPTALSDRVIEVLNQINSDPATQHLSHLAKYKILCQRLGSAQVPSYHTVYRYLNKSPELYTRKKRERYLHAHHPSTCLPGEVWVVDRYRADVFCIDPFTGEAARPEVIVIIDKATRAILAIGAAYRAHETTTRKRFHFDAHLAGTALLQAIRGEITGVPHFPQRFVLDWGKVEGAERITEYLTYHGVIIDKARPYTPHDKAEIEGGVIAHIHSQLESKLPGYCGPDNRPDAQPGCWNGKPKQVITTKGVYLTDDAGRPLLTIDEYNDELRKFAENWNNSCSNDIRYRNIPRIARLQPLLQHPKRHQINYHYAETYLLPGATRTVYEDGTIQIAGRRYYHPALVALRAYWGSRAKVYARYSITDRSRVYLYWLDQSTGEPTYEWLWHWDNPETPSLHPWYRSQAVWYNRDEHRDGDPYHEAWVTLTRAVNQAARHAANELRANPIADHQQAINYIAARIWGVVERHLPRLLEWDSPSQAAGADDSANLDGAHWAQPRMDAERPVLTAATDRCHNDSGDNIANPANPAMMAGGISPLELERLVMQRRREQAERWRRQRYGG